MKYFTGHIEAVNSVNVEAMVGGPAGEGGIHRRANGREGPAAVPDRLRTSSRRNSKQAEANVVLAKAHLKRLEADLRRAKALLPTKAISQQDYDTGGGRPRRGGRHASSAVEAARNSAKDNLDYTTVRAKFAGRIGRRMIDPGNMVRANETVLTTLVSTDKMYVYFDVDERTTINIRKLIDTSQNPPRAGRDRDRLRAGRTKRVIPARPRSIFRQPDQHVHGHVAAAGID